MHEAVAGYEPLPVRGPTRPLPVYESVRHGRPPCMTRPGPYAPPVRTRRPCRRAARGVRAARASCVAPAARSGGTSRPRCAPGRVADRVRGPAIPAGPPPPPALPPPAQRWRRVFPGQEAELRRIRSWLAELLPSGPAREDVVTVATELAANAVRHTASGAHGFFAVELTWQMRPVTVRVAVADSGARTSPHLEPGTDPLGPGPLGIGSPGAGLLSADQLGSGQLSEHGRGLRVVRALAERTGVCGDHRGRLVWAEIRWTSDGAVLPDFPDGYEASLRDIQAVLAVRYPEADIWFGRATMQWWALIGRPERGHPEARRLLTAESPVDLAQLLDVARATAQPRTWPQPRQARGDWPAARPPTWSARRPAGLGGGTGGPSRPTPHPAGDPRGPGPVRDPLTPAGRTAGREPCDSRACARRSPEALRASGGNQPDRRPPRG